MFFWIRIESLHVCYSALISALYISYFLASHQFPNECLRFQLTFTGKFWFLLVHSFIDDQKWWWISSRSLSQPIQQYITLSNTHSFFSMVTLELKRNRSCDHWYVIFFFADVYTKCVLNYCLSPSQQQRALQVSCVVDRIVKQDTGANVKSTNFWTAAYIREWINLAKFDNIILLSTWPPIKSDPRPLWVISLSIWVQFWIAFATVRKGW